MVLGGKNGYFSWCVLDADQCAYSHLAFGKCHLTASVCFHVRSYGLELCPTHPFASSPSPLSCVHEYESIELICLLVFLCCIGIVFILQLL